MNGGHGRKILCTVDVARVITCVLLIDEEKSLDGKKMTWTKRLIHEIYTESTVQEIKSRKPITETHCHSTEL